MYQRVNIVFILKLNKSCIKTFSLLCEEFGADSRVTALKISGYAWRVGGAIVERRVRFYGNYFEGD
jgi:hypothetical protein